MTFEKISTFRGIYVLSEEEKERVEEILNELTMIFGADNVAIEAPSYALGKKDITLTIQGSILGIEEAI